MAYIKLHMRHVNEVMKLASPDRSVIEIRRMMTEKISDTSIYYILDTYQLPYRRRRESKVKTSRIFDKNGVELFNIDAYKNAMI